MQPRPFLPVLLALLVVLPACGPDGARTASQEEVPVRDTTVPPIERQPLSEMDEVGLDPMNLTVELPWTRNQLSRDPAEAAARATVLGLETLSTDAFDRVVVRFSRDAPFPGYRVRLVQDPAGVTCAGSDEPLVEEGPLLAVTLDPVSVGDESGLSRGIRTLGQPLFHEAGVACVDGGTLTWVAAVGEGTEVRVLELRDPARLVVDLR